MDMRSLMQIVEGASQEDDLHYYMSEGCGAFAYALWLAYGKPATGEVGVISRRDGDAWSRTIDFEVTHAFFEINGNTIDVRGIRGLEEMADELHILDNYSYQGSWTPADFKKLFMGNSDRKPLYGDMETIREAYAVIMANPERYGVDPSKATKMKPAKVKVPETPQDAVQRFMKRVADFCNNHRYTETTRNMDLRDLMKLGVSQEEADAMLPPAASYKE